ncbi:hypothetical protein D9757_002633 [Collybiopsis confluens]|uniref:AAA+ ATPase domain-containing protein n=1 Tax=Collybiopsis confluens TaxID=2823264 RepID=A0A8H5HWA0_9AGAR|nr:hypothetical protein D9757_002633 [Collybiopsis confluens]
MADSKQTGFVDDWDDVLAEIALKKESPNFHHKWIEQASAKHTDPLLMAFVLLCFYFAYLSNHSSSNEALRKLYPKHSLVTTDDFRLNILNYPGAQIVPLKDNPLVTSVGFSPLNRMSAPIPGMLTDRVIAGGFTLNWQAGERPSNYEQPLILSTEHPVHSPYCPGLMGFNTATFILHEGPEDPARQLLLAVGLWAEAIHNEVWVFNQGYWQKDPLLWESFQSADWKDVILKEDFKKAFQKDIFGFFESEELYKELGIPWKRGLIMHGPPGNGKTISLKAVMKTCDARGYPPLYVKSFQSYAGDEYSMKLVFGKARQLAPCVVILEDIDSLITDRNRSFFLNELDGLAGNDGLLVLATTNHFDRLDPGLSSRPSRFDRKYFFNDPDREERALYAVYWQKKLKDNKSIDFPDELVDEVAGATKQFSFAYLKEAFVSTLVTLAGLEDEDKPSFRTVLLKQIDALRKQLDTPKKVVPAPSRSTSGSSESRMNLVPHPRSHRERDSEVLSEAIRRQIPSQDGLSSRIFVPPPPPLLPPRAPPLHPTRLESEMNNLRSHIQIPGGFNSSQEDDFGHTFSYLPSQPNRSRGSVDNSLPGISGFWL